MRWTDPPSDHDHLLVLWWCPFLLFSGLWGQWGPSGGWDALWLAWGQMGGGVWLLLAVHSWLGGEGGRARCFLRGATTKAQQTGMMCLDGLGGGALCLAYVGGYDWAALALGVAVVSRIFWVRKQRVWLEQEGVWLGGFPLQRMRFVHLRHVWREGGCVRLRDERGRGVDIEAADAQEAERWEKAILEAQQAGLAGMEEGFVAQRRGEGGWEVKFGSGEALFVSSGWSLDAMQGQGESLRSKRWRVVLGGVLCGVWCAIWWLGLAKAGGMASSWGRGTLHFLLGLGSIVLVCRQSGEAWVPKGATLRWFGPMGALRCYRGIVRISLIGLGVWLLWDLMRFAVWGSALHWTSWWILVSSVLIVALDPSGAMAWMVRVKGEPWMRRVGWRERMPIERWESVAWCRGVLFWKEGGIERCAVLPCRVDAKAAAMWLFGEIEETPDEADSTALEVAVREDERT